MSIKKELFTEVKQDDKLFLPQNKTITPKKETTQNLILRCLLSPGDIVILSYAVKSLKEQYGNEYKVGVETSSNDIFEGNPHIDRDLMSAYYDYLNKPEEVRKLMSYKQDNNDYVNLDVKGQRLKTRIINCGYDSTIHQSNQKPVMFVNAFSHELGKQLGIHLEPCDWQGSIYIRDEEKSWYSAVYEITGKNPPYFVMDAGHKTDFTCKAWDFRRYQKVVDSCPDVLFVQIGAKHPDHIHPELTGRNLINMVGKTDIRQLIRLVYHSFGVISPVSFPMTLAHAVEPHPRFNRKSRALITVAGNREPPSWQSQMNAIYLHNGAALNCSDGGGGCWKSRVVPLGNLINGKPDPKDNPDNLCRYPIKLDNGQFIPKCLDMISADEVINAVRKHIDNLEYKDTI